MGRGAPCAQEGPHHHYDDGERSHWDDDNNDQDVVFPASQPWFTWTGWKIELDYMHEYFFRHAEKSHHQTTMKIWIKNVR